MPYIHVLDLAQDGVIKPHVDSSRVIRTLFIKFCECFNYIYVLVLWIDNSWT